MNYLISIAFLNNNKYNAKTILLYRFHIIVIAVNLLAAIIDFNSDRGENAWIEIAVMLILSLNAWRLRQNEKSPLAPLIFLLTVAAGLFAQIWLNHFGTMSVVFVLLLPLTTMLFFRIYYTFIAEAMMIIVLALLLYWESLYNPSNPILQNPKALFHLGYAAGIIYIFGLLYHFSILKTFSELDESNRQKELLLKEVHHRVKNNLNVIASIIGLQAVSLGDREKEQLFKSKVRIESIAMVHEMIYRSNDLESVDFADYMRKLSDLLLSMSGRSDTISVKIDTDTKTLSLETMVQLGIMANEMLTNSIKYAFESNGGEIVIRLEKEEDGYRFDYWDNGRGVEDIGKIEESDSLGVKLIRLTAMQIGGKVLVDSKDGLKYTIRFKNG